MRRTLLIALLAALIAPAGAFAASAAGAAATDGTLSVRGGDGVLKLIAFRGAAIGRVEDGRVTVVEPRGDACDTPLVWGWETVEARFLRGGDLGQGRLACIYHGPDLRFRLTGTSQEISVRGSNISASIVGRGSALLQGDGGLLDGTYSLNGLEYRSLPDELQRLTLGTPLPGS